jgi:hypothetical protein
LWPSQEFLSLASILIGPPAALGRRQQLDRLEALAGA